MSNLIVIVEDDPFMKDLYKIVLKRAEINCVVLEDGDALINILQTENVSLLLMDINLKNTYLKNNKVDGILLSKHIKSDETLSHIPIIIVSAYSDYSEMERIKKETFACDYITKPITSFEKFTALLKKTLLVNGYEQSTNC